ncbi:MAG TPA: DedA family protein [Solirubrobacteraceae bacterium]|nr:DedA family protein [Solirubrobacteraceae bacterium]
MHHLIIYASVTSSLVNLATHIVRDLGYAGVGLLTLMSGVVGVPGTEATMLFAGFNVFQHHLSMFGVVVAGVIGDLIGATVAYLIGRLGLYELLDRRGSPLHVNPRRLEMAHHWFERFGPPVVLVSRLIPLFRAVFPYAAGTARMGYVRFMALTIVGSIIWITGLGLLGRAVGSQWSAWKHNLDYVDYAVVALIVIGLAYLVVRRVRTSRERAPV